MLKYICESHHSTSVTTPAASQIHFITFIENNINTNILYSYILAWIREKPADCYYKVVTFLQSMQKSLDPLIQNPK